jgi:copper transport protein
MSAAVFPGSFSVATPHVTLVASSPAAGSRLSAAPERIRLEFSETLDASVARISIAGSDGVARRLAVASDPSNAYALVATVPATGPGAFRVTWRVVSDDGHPVGGSFSFAVGAEAAPLPAETSGDGGAEPWGPALSEAPLIPALLRGIGVAALAALAGLLAWSHGAVQTAAQRRVAMWLAVAAPILLGAHLMSWLVHTAPDHRLTSEWTSSAFASSAGRAELWRAILAVAPLWALGLARRRGLALVLAVPALLLSASIGHAAAFQPLVSIPRKAVHLAAMAAWLGGLTWLSASDMEDRSRLLHATLRVSSLSLISFAAIAASGAGQAIILLPSISAVQSAYGALLAAKVAGLVVLAGFGAYHRFRVLPRLSGDAGNAHAASFARSLRTDIAVLWLVAIVAGVLSYTSPPEAAGHHHISPGSEQ